VKLLEGRRAIITGASQGLGRAIAAAYVDAGASVLLCARGGGQLEEARAELGQRTGPGQQVLATVADVTNAGEVRALIGRAIEAFGHIDILVNNAGVYGPKGTIDEVDWAEWARAVEINLHGTVLPTREVLPHMRSRRYGKIVNLSGGGATNPLPNLSAYAASKAAVVRFTETVAQEVAAVGIDINAVAPGALNTRLLDEVIDAGPERVGAAFHARAVKQKAEGGVPLERGAELSVFLASPASDGITGRLLSAVWDPWPSLSERKAELSGSDIYTLRRIVPGDRGKSWEMPK
jgi:NAD(P)-dependent dehydrogenase (short-subunit alcohol dehydrogenase family)